MFRKLKTRLKFILSNAYIELIMLYTLFILMILIPVSSGLFYYIAPVVRDVTGNLLDPLVPFVRMFFDYGVILVIGFILLILLIIFIYFIKLRKDNFISGILLYDIFNNYNRDFKTMSGVILPLIFMMFYSMYFLLQISSRGFNFLNIFIMLGVTTITLTLIAYVGQINKIMTCIKNIGRLDIKDSINGQYLFTGKALNMLQDTDENIKIIIDEQLKSERLKTELITNISHDLKTPLTSIINYTDLLKNYGIEDEQVSDYIDVLDRNSHRLKVLITDLVYASKAETGNVDIALDTLELNELVSQVYGEFDYLFRERDITFIFDPIEDIYVLADSNHLGRVLINIMDNAIKYSQEGTRIYASTKVEGDYTSLSVKNISKEKLNISPDELMERFIRGERSRHTEGSGLGLYISRSLMELMRGKLTLGIDGDLFEVKLLIPSVKSP